MLDGRFRFDNYVVGTANRLAASAARAVAEAPGAAYNPLFIYGRSGLGKTHLLAALGHHVHVMHPRLVVEYATFDDFVEARRRAIASGQADAFQRRYEQLDVLLLDDVQYLGGRADSQSELLRVFNVMQGIGRQIAMTCDRPPSDIADVDARLLTRLSGGLIVDVGVPDYETRVAILRHECDERSLRFGAGVLEELARAPTGSVRELQGALNKLAAHQSIGDEPLSAADVGRVTGGRDSGGATDEFEAFVNELAETVAQSVEGWRARLAERIARWSGEGFHTASLERHLDDADPPDLEKVERVFAAAADRLRELEAQAIRIDPARTGAAVFRDPARLREAEDEVARMQASIEPSPMPDEHPADLGALAGSRPPLDSFFFDGEKVVAEWPDLDGRVVEDLR